MMQMLLPLLALLLLTLLSPAGSRSIGGSLTLDAPPHSVRIQHLDADTHPDLVIDTHTPHFTWQLADDDTESSRGVTQSAYQLRLQTVDTLLRAQAQPLAWDTGRVMSSNNRYVFYDGPLLSSDTTYQWSLKYWNNQGRESQWATGLLRTALFSRHADFTGQWIGHTDINMNELRKEFTTPDTLTRATVFITGIGYYELYLNGTQIDPTRRLDPGYTLYEKDVLYSSFDVTSLLTANNAAAIGVRLGDGWFSQQQNPPNFGAAHPSYGPSRLLFQLNLQRNDGSVVSIVSDTTWQGREGMVTQSSPFMGESYSALKERDSWSLPGFSDPLSLWINAIVLPSPLSNTSSSIGGLRMQPMDPIRAGDAALRIATSGRLTGAMGAQPGVQGGNLLAGGVLHPISVHQPNVGTYVYDLGQNFAGTCTTTFTGVPARMTVHLTHAEVLRQPGANGVQYWIGDPSNLRGASSTDIYITKGIDGESYTPSFTVHGFRYFSVYGLYNVNQIKDVTCNFIHSTTTLIGNLTTSNPVVNQLQHNIQWGTLSNMMSVPTDCPQRDERRGWTGDAALSVDAVLFNFDLVAYYESWLIQFELEQGTDGSVNDIVPDDGGGRPADPNWGTAYPSIVWQLHEHYGDLSVFQRHYSGVRAWIECMRGQYNQTGLAGFYYHYGDWVPPR